jgi:TonB-linked SusC/RagA family outer membrane protein
MRNFNSMNRAWICLMGAQLFWFGGVKSQSVYAYNGPHKTVSRTEKMSLDESPEQKQKLFSVLKQLNESKGVYFLFSEQSLGEKMVNPMGGTTVSIEKMLNQILKNTGLTFKKINDKTFVILSTTAGKSGTYQASPVNFSNQSEREAYSMNVPTDIISGKVVDASGAPLAGITVMIKGTKRGTTTLGDGTFSLQANKGDILVISSVGYVNQEIVVGEKTDYGISLLENNKKLDEVIVTSLGIKKQARVIGYSTTEVDGSKFTQARESNLGNALSGQIAGVNVSGISTGPSGSSRVTIRGNSSLSGNSQPLYVIDGIPYDNTAQGSSGKWGGADYGDGLSNINPDDIENVQVLKGVAASALYGFRGGNGAILITTKSGNRSRGLGVEVNNNATVNSVIDDRDYQYDYGQGVQGVKPITKDAAQNSEYYSWGAKMDGSQATNFLGNTYNYSPAKDNYKNFYQKGITNQTSVALLGSNDKGHFRLGLSNLYNGEVIPNANMKQQGVNFNTTYNVTSKFQFNLTANYIFEQVKNRVSFSDAPGNVTAGPLYLGNTFDIRWLKPRVDAKGNELLPGSDVYFNNPYFVAYDFNNTTARQRFTGGLNLKYNILDWLFVQAGATRDGYIFDENNIVPTGTGYVPGGQITVKTVDFHELNWNWLVGVNKKFGKDFSFNASVGGNSMDNVSSSSAVNAAGPFVIPYFYSLNNVASRPYTVGYQRYHVNSIYGSADIGYKNFLFFTVTGRNDWFSTLNPKTNSYLYPAYSASFVFSDALKLPYWVNFGKLRAAYAQSSNGTIPYQNLLTYGLQGYTINSQVLGYVNQSVVPNAFLKPLNISEKEIGLNMEFFGSRLGFDVAFYNKKTTDDIVQVTVSPTSGYIGNIENIGEIQNKGVEILLTGSPVVTKNFSWNISFNIAQNNSKVLALGPDGNPIVIAGAFPRWGDAVNISNVVGLPYGQIMGYAYKRDAAGNKIFDANGNPEQSSKVVPLGSGNYKETGGFSNEFRYKNFSLAFLIDFKYGAKIYSGTNILLYNYGLQKTTLQGREGGYVGKGVQEDGSPNKVAVNAQTYFQNISTGSDQIAEEFVYDASFIKLRSLSIGYTIPANALKGSFVKGVGISLVARNLATLMKHTPNIDPESNYTNTAGQGLELSGYPAIRTMGININLKF